jgi:hypothetical protein
MKGMQLGDFILQNSTETARGFELRIFRWRTVKDGMILVYPNSHQLWIKM